MRQLLSIFFFFILFASAGQKVFSQCNPAIYGQDTVCTGSTAYLYTDNNYVSYSWSNGSNYSYTYAAPGTITLTTMDSQGCTGNTTIVVVSVPSPQVSFNLSLFGYSVQCTNTSSNSYSYQWVFGDGSTSNAVNPIHTFNSKGNYTVCLNSNDHFCGNESYCEEVTIGTSLGMPTDSLIFRLFKNTNITTLNKLVQNPVDSGYLIAAQYDNCGECSNPMLIKTTKNGRVEWTRTLDYLYNIENLSYFDNGYVFTSQNADYSVVKIDLNGNPVWQKYDNYYGDKILFPFSNNRLGLIINGDPLQVTVFDAGGNTLSQKSYNLGGFDLRFNGFARSSGNTVLLNGEYSYNFVLALPHQQYYWSGGFDSQDQVTAKMDSTGNIMWINGVYVNTDCHDNGEPLQMPAGDLIFPGRFFDVVDNSNYYFISHFDAAGTFINAYQVDSMKGLYSTFLSGSNVVIASRPVPPVFDSLRVMVFDNQFSVAAAKKITAYNTSNVIRTYDDRLASAFIYFDNTTFTEFPSLYKTNLTATTGCLDAPIAAGIHPLFPYVYSIPLPAITPTYNVSDTALFSLAALVVDSFECSSCNLSVNIQLSADTFICPGETVVLTAPSGYYDYTWSNGSHSQSITVSDAGTYVLQVFDYRGCTAIDSVRIAEGVEYNVLFNIVAPNGFCEGTPYSILAYDSAFQSIYQVLWNTGSGSNIIYSSQSGTFVVTFFDANGCPTTDSIVVEMDLPVPALTISGPTNVCSGDSVLLCASFSDNGSGPYTFSWNQGAYTDSCNYVTGGQYDLIINSASGCADTSAPFTVNTLTPPDPGLQPQNTVFICNGADTVLSADPGFSQYLWSTIETTSSIQVNTPGIYWVLVTDNSGCQGGDTVTVLSGSAYNPVFELDTTSNFCEGTPFVLTVSDSLQQTVASYSWSTGATTASITTSQSGTYSVILTDSDGCTAVDSIEVTMHENSPPVSISGPLNVCDGGIEQLCAVFTGNGTGPYSFSWNQGAYSDSCIDIAGGQFDVILTNAFGCADTSSSFSVNVLALPDPGLEPQNSVLICVGADTILSADAGFSQYLWSTNETTSSIHVNSPGSYSVLVTDNSGCQGMDSVMVESGLVYYPVFDLDTTINFCEGTPFVLSVSDSLSQAVASYSWSTGGTTASITSGQSGTYVATLTDADGCSSLDSIEITMHDRSPVVSVSGPQDVCDGSTVQLCVAFTDNGSGPYSYSWNSGSFSDSCIHVAAGNYEVVLANAWNCNDASSIHTITNHLLPVPNIQPPDSVSVCTGTDTVLCAASGFSGYLWSTGVTVNCVTVFSGNYSVTVTDGFGCTGTESVVVTDYQPQQPVILPDSPPIDTLFSSAPTGNQWYEVGVGIIPGAVFNYFVPSHNGLYTVIITDANGCSSLPADTLNFIYSFIQVTGLSDLLSVYPNPANKMVFIKVHQDLLGYTLDIYNAIGQIIFESESVNENPFSVFIENFSPGIYTGIIQSGKEKIMFKIDKY